MDVGDAEVMPLDMIRVVLAHFPIQANVRVV
jgi:hypothetical protein